MVTIKSHITHNVQVANDLARLAHALSDNKLDELRVTIGEYLVEAAQRLTPIITGSLASSHAVHKEGDHVFVASSKEAYNPESDERPWQYGPKVHRMGGISESGHRRDYYNTVVETRGEEILLLAEKDVIISLEVFG